MLLTGFTGPKWVWISDVKSTQLEHHLGALTGSGSMTPFSNHSSADFFKQLIAKNTLAESVAYCCGCEWKASWHCRRNGHKSSGLEPSNASGALMSVLVGAGGAGGGMLAEFHPTVTAGDGLCHMSHLSRLRDGF